MQVLTADTDGHGVLSLDESTFTNQQIAMDFSQSQTSNLAFKVLNNANITGQNSHAINSSAGCRNRWNLAGQDSKAKRSAMPA